MRRGESSTRACWISTSSSPVDTPNSGAAQAWTPGPVALSAITFLISLKRSSGSMAVSLIISAWITGVICIGSPPTSLHSSIGMRILDGSVRLPTQTHGRPGKLSRCPFSVK